MLHIIVLHIGGLHNIVFLVDKLLSEYVYIGKCSAKRQIVGTSCVLCVMCLCLCLQGSVEPLLRSGFYTEPFSLLNHVETS